MKLLKLICIVHLVLAPHGLQARDMFTALVELTTALRAESSVAKDLNNYISQELQRIQKLQQVAKDLEEHSRKALENPMTHLANPVNAYLLVKRFAVDWSSVVDNYIEPRISQEFLTSLSQRTSHFPDAEDMTGSALALLRLQDVYALPTSEIASGHISGVLKSPGMNADDCFQLGMVAYNRHDYYHTVMWMGEAALKDFQEEVKTTNRKKILDYLSFAMYKQGNMHHAYNLTKEWLEIEPGSERALANLRYFEDQLAEKQAGEQTFSKELVNLRNLPGYSYSADYDRYERLCRGEETDKYLMSNKLTCQYKRHKPTFFIKPLKEEIVYLEPLIMVYHHVLNQKEVDKMKQLATPMLARSGVFKINADADTFPEYRTSKTAWLSDPMDPIIGKLSDRTSALTNLTIDTVEFFQVLNYGIAGQYEPHYDFARANELNTFEEWRGNRLTTVIYYLNDVEAGGATVFNELGIRLLPEKGACVVWYNLLLNGEGDYRTKHAGCPVLSGTKWVSNKWFHINGQEFIRPCSTAMHQ